MITQRFNGPNEWNLGKANHLFLGLSELIIDLQTLLIHNKFKGSEMIEIGSYMGESTMLFGSSQLFNKIYAIDPHMGNEAFNELSNSSWKEVEKQFSINTRFFNNIELIQDYSENIVTRFEDKSIDFIYIDANHTYESVKKDLDLYIPKLKSYSIIAGHDYCNINWPGVIKAVNEVLGEPTKVYQDSSWMFIKKDII